MAGPFVGNSVKREKKNPQSIESQWIADWSECRDSNSGPLEPHSDLGKIKSLILGVYRNIFIKC